MNYSRKEVKLAARAAIRGTAPSPKLVTLVYLLLTSLMPLLCIAVVSLPLLWLAPDSAGNYRDPFQFFTFSAFFAIFLFVLMLLYTLVMSMGYYHYAMNVSRGRPSGYRDLFRGFSMVGRTLALSLLVTLFAALWGVLGGGVYGLVFLLFTAVLNGSGPLFGVLAFLFYLALLVFLCNRTLRYSLAQYLLLDRPDYAALDAIRESKRLMKGHLWHYFVLCLSFLGWMLIPVLILYAVMLVGMLLSSALTALPPVALLSLVGFLAMIPIEMWLQAYISVSSVGFYDCISQPPAVDAAPYVSHYGPLLTPDSEPTPAPQPPAAPEPFAAPTADRDDNPDDEEGDEPEL